MRNFARFVARTQVPTLLVAATCGSLGFWGFAEPACAQELAQKAIPVALTNIQLISESPSASKFRLIFSPRANTFGPVGSDSGKAAVGFAMASRGNGAVSPPNLKGIVRQLSFDQVDTVLIVRFNTTGPVQVTTKQVDPGTIDITVSNGVERAAPPTNVQVRTTFEPTQGDGYEMVMLRYADVSEIVGLLTDGLTVKSNDNFVPREPGFGSQNLTGTSYTQPTPNGPDQSNEPLGQSADSSIAIDRRLNAIWLKGTPERIARLKAQIAQIDLPVDSVVLETELVELDANGSHEIGIDFANAAGQLATFTSQSGQFIPAGDLANTGGHLNQAGSVVGGRLDSGGLQAAVYAQVSKGNGKIVSRPRIVAQSGGTAKIITGDALPILTAITLSGVNGVSQQVQYVNVGVTLQIAPRVSADGFVTSHVFCVVSSATGTSQGYPTISQREAETQVTVKDGETFVIGGLTQDTTSNRDSKVPGLGDIPMVGQLFHHKSMSKQKTELYIVVTPHVIHHGQSSVAASIR